MKRRFTKMANAKQIKTAMAMLAAIVAATAEGKPTEVSTFNAGILAEKGLVALNPNGPNADGATIAVMATEEGKAAASVPAETSEVEKVSFELETGIVPPAAKRTGRAASSLYPFDKMEVGTSFFVAATAAKPEPAKSLASTVSSATARFAEEVKNEDGSPKMKTNRKGKLVVETVNTKVFVVREAEKDGVKGARVFRTA